MKKPENHPDAPAIARPAGSRVRNRGVARIEKKEVGDANEAMGAERGSRSAAGNVRRC